MLPSRRLLTRDGYAPCIALFATADAVLTLLIIRFVPFTEIDYTTYINQARLFLAGERNYARIDPAHGTGPCVYPALHLYLYALLSHVSLRTAQFLFALVYVVTFLLVAQIYKAANAPPFLLAFLLLSKRLHSIYVLRLFNDPLGMLFLYASILLLCKRRYLFASVLYRCVAPSPI